eukprot:3710757-Rhodomonas_salina.1
MLSFCMLASQPIGGYQPTRLLAWRRLSAYAPNRADARYAATRRWRECESGWRSTGLGKALRRVRY